jgi:hypothetical protein
MSTQGERVSKLEEKTATQGERVSALEEGYKFICDDIRDIRTNVKDIKDGLNGSLATIKKDVIDPLTENVVKLRIFKGKTIGLVMGIPTLIALIGLLVAMFK